MRPFILGMVIPPETLLDDIGNTSCRSDKGVEIVVEVWLPSGHCKPVCRMPCRIVETRRKQDLAHFVKKKLGLRQLEFSALPQVIMHIRTPGNWQWKLGRHLRRALRVRSEPSTRA